MTDYKLVPVEPTLDMLCEGTDVYGSEDCAETDVLGIYKAMLAASPAVQGEPVAWLCEWESWQQYHDESAPMPEAWDNPPTKITPLYAAPQPAEQQPAPDVSALVAALERSVAGFVALSGMTSLGAGARNYARQKAIEMNASLAAHRKQGGGK